MTYIMDVGRNYFSDLNRRAGDTMRRINRFVEGPITRKKLIIILLFAIFLLLYLGPGITNWLFYSHPTLFGYHAVCHKNFLSPFEDALHDYDVYIREERTKQSSLSHNFVPYVGNGKIGLALEHDSHLNIKYGRTLSLAVNYQPLYIVNDNDISEVTLIEYKKGIVHRFQCTDSGLQISYQYYAHRTVPSLFVQEIIINNPNTSRKTVKFSTPRIFDWISADRSTVKLHQGAGTEDYELIHGKVKSPDKNKVVYVVILTRQIKNTLIIEAREAVELTIFTVVRYSEFADKEYAIKNWEGIKSNAIEDMSKIIALTTDKADMIRLRDNHSRVWQSLWSTGFYISDSKADGVVNGDRINATIYAILSQVRSYEHEENIRPSFKAEILRTLTYSEGCYEGHSTLDAFNLWKPLNNLQNLNSVASVWLLTLEKQGCHKLLRAGASGVNQAVILSFGSFRFSNQHLEYNIHPSKLHRDFQFRRINYGNMTHVNVSVIVQEDNKAAIFVALDRSDRTYYGCDAGCLDAPVQLGAYRKYFPVKLTEPLTAILYITADKQHMEDLRHAIHVKEVVEAPPHEGHLIALHKHGNALGGLNPFVWISIICLIVFFHLFLCRIIMNEYCDSAVSYRRLYNKP